MSYLQVRIEIELPRYSREQRTHFRPARSIVKPWTGGQKDRWPGRVVRRDQHSLRM